MTSKPPRRWVKALRVGCCLGGIVTVYARLVAVAAEPFHARGLGQPVTGFLNGLNHLLQLPGLCLARVLGVQTGHHVSPIAHIFIIGINLLVYFVAGLLLGASLRRDRDRTHAALPAPSPVVSRRRFLTTGLKVLGGGAVAGFGYSLLVEPRWFEVSRRTFRLRGLPPSLAGLRVVQLTDIHHGPWLSRAYVRQVIQAAIALQPDLVLLTGDYVHRAADYIKPVVEELARLQARIATVAVLGNHDWWEDPGLVRAELQRVGIPLLDNTRRILTPDRRLLADANEGLAICGVGDLWRDIPDCQRALGGLPPEMPRLLLSHNPDVAEEASLVRSGLRVDLMVSGHTHGGQIFLPLLGAPGVPSFYGQKYRAGLVQGPVCPVFICRGIGVSGLPLRFGAPPEIAVLELEAAPA